ncbi:Oocyte-expressed protein like protein [Myotis brandtii]|uniref:Oocyte-expressed protein like protein n=1 Tax=Myotis brandtii TaxID=109478 RepID=S7QFE9_MYOBR|nr:Oocyte-expressed protein like protein [Myotis brandtii]
MVDTANAWKVVEITVFGQPLVQNRLKSVLLSLVSRLWEPHAPDEKMEQLEEFLESRRPAPIARYCQETRRPDLLIYPSSRGAGPFRLSFLLPFA